MAGSQREIGECLAEFALEHQYLTGDVPELPERDGHTQKELFKAHGGPLADRAEGVAACFAGRLS